MCAYALLMRVYNMCNFIVIYECLRSSPNDCVCDCRHIFTPPQLTTNKIIQAEFISFYRKAGAMETYRANVNGTVSNLEAVQHKYQSGVCNGKFDLLERQLLSI